MVILKMILKLFLNYQGKLILLLTARDNKEGGGVVIQEDFKINFIQSENGIFKVFSQNTNGLTVNQDEEIEIRWNHLAAPYTENVDIDISYDGGNSFTYNLATSTPNDGNETVIVPKFNKSQNARIRVKLLIIFFMHLMLLILLFQTQFSN